MTSRDRLAIATLRGLALDLPFAARSGHSGTAMALAPLGWLLYSQILRHRPEQPDWPDRDRLVMSNGHACVLLYGLLHLCGYDLSMEDLHGFRVPGSRTPGHPESWVTPGIDFSTGPLGQGLAAAVGMAWGARLRGREHFVYVLCSDGDLMEGVSAEASSLAGHQRLGRLIVFYDDNQVTIDGPGSLSWSEDVGMRYRAYGWQVLEVADGESLEELRTATLEAQASETPTLIRVRTVIGYPAPEMSGRCEAHSPPFSAEEIRRTKEILGLSPERSFQIPPELTPTPAVRNSRPASPGRRAVPATWTRPVFEQPLATRVAGGLVLNSLAEHMPELVGGSADLAGSTNSWLHNRPEQNLRFGVREGAMAAICNGMAQDRELLPFCSTYFAFSDQMKPALRLAALAGLHAIFIWTHDSLALGEDGPTHQPVEQLATLRAMPNFLVFRPADANETAECWELAVAHGTGPVGLILSRQTLPCLPPSGQVEKGAYPVLDGPDQAPTLLSTGSEVHLCLAAAALLDFPVRVVSMPCWELFELQSDDYRRRVLGGGARFAVEAAASLGWHRWVEGRGEVLGLDRFGASGPGAELMESYGFSPAAVAAMVRSRVEFPATRTPAP